MCASRIIGLWCAISTSAPVSLRAAPLRNGHRSKCGGGFPDMNEPAAWTTERDAQGIVWLTLDVPGTSANVLSSAVLRELDAILQDLLRNPPTGVIVLSGKKSGFIAGADIKEFTSIASAEDGYGLIRSGQQVLDHLEALPCPTVAAIQGFALGGGLELAL